MNQFNLMLHPMLGVLFILVNAWIFTETLGASPEGLARVRKLSLVSAALLWITYVIAGYWYVAYFAADKAIILAGPWPYAHTFFMEMKEHAFFPLLLLGTYLPIVAYEAQPDPKAANQLVRWVAGLNVLLGLVMEGAGGIISMGVKVGLLAKH